jgi:hypothetical protein
MTVRRAPITAPSAWEGRGLRQRTDWIEMLTAAELAEIGRAIETSGVRDMPVERITKSDFPLPGLGDRLGEAAAEVRDGRGFCLLRGFPSAAYTADDARRIFWALGLHFGAPVSQNSKGELLSHVTDAGGDIKNARTRGYETRQGLKFHTDRADVTALFCLRPALRGGHSSLVSSMAIHNTIAATRPDLLQYLYDGYPIIHVDRAGDSVPRRVPVYSIADDVLSCGIQRNTVEKAIRAKVMPVGPEALEALDLFDSLANDGDLRLDFDLEAGDMLFINNYTAMHARTSFEDHADPAKKRCLARLWLRFDQAWPVVADFADTGGVEIG